MPYAVPKGKSVFFTTKDLIYDEYYVTYICPNDETLLYKRIMPTRLRLYVSDTSICRDCPLLSKCNDSKDSIKQIIRHVWKDHLDIVEDLRFVDRIKKQ